MCGNWRVGTEIRDGCMGVIFWSRRYIFFLSLLGVIYGSSRVGILACVLLHGIDHVWRNEQSFLLTDRRNPFCESALVYFLFSHIHSQFFFYLIYTPHSVYLCLLVSDSVIIDSWVCHSFIYPVYWTLILVRVEEDIRNWNYCLWGRIRY